MVRIVLIDYGSGNLRSAAKAFERVAPEGASLSVSDRPQALGQATHIVLPGVGAFADCMRGLEAVPGLRAALEKQILEMGKPFLGICVGMQMLFEAGHEHGTHKGLGWLAGEVNKIEAPGLKIPHMGWNELAFTQPQDALVSGLENGAHAYFVHSYQARCAQDLVLATTDYANSITAVVRKNNIMGTQFHPEKSQGTGLRIIRNFLAVNSLS